MYYSPARNVDRIGPGEIPGPITVTGSPCSRRPIGEATEVDPLGSWIDDIYIGPAEAVWSLIIGGSPIPGRFALRWGLFVEVEREP